MSKCYTFKANNYLESKCHQMLNKRQKSQNMTNIGSMMVTGTFILLSCYCFVLLQVLNHDNSLGIPKRPFQPWNLWIQILSIVTYRHKMSLESLFNIVKQRCDGLPRYLVAPTMQKAF